MNITPKNIAYTIKKFLNLSSYFIYFLFAISKLVDKLDEDGEVYLSSRIASWRVFDAFINSFFLFTT